VVDLTGYSIKVKSNGLDSSIALDTISSLSFGAAAPAPGAPETRLAPSSGNFGREVDTVMIALQAMAGSAKSGADYTDYGRQLSELRPQVERFIARFSGSDSGKETRTVALLAGALTDYTWARTIWTLKLGRASDGTIAEADSPLIGDVLGLYPDLRAAAANGNRFAADRLIAGLWKKASEKVERIGSTVSR